LIGIGHSAPRQNEFLSVHRQQERIAMQLNRRGILYAALAAGPAAAVSHVGEAQAQAAPALNVGIDRALEAIRTDADKLGVAPPQSRDARRRTNLEDAALELGDIVDKSLVKAKDGAEDASNLADRAGLLLSEINRAKRDANADLPVDDRRASRWTYDRLKGEYNDLFKRCKVADKHRPELLTAARRITAADPMRRYKRVESDTGVPWYVIGALHYREASLNFMGHLHNGDFLRLKTTQVPANRPKGPWPPNPWDAEEAWRLSAVDALERYKNVPGWKVERMLFTFEDYNGWGYRAHPGYRTPYLWNYTQIYTGGGFPHDHQWRDTYMSKQAGLASILRMLVEVAPAQVSLGFDA
jgi:lysozyme family protein